MKKTLRKVIEFIKSMFLSEIDEPLTEIGDREINKIIVHCSATSSLVDIGVDTLREWHVKDNGWSDVGYHFVIKRDGTIEDGRDLDKVGAHTKGHNKKSIGICLIGGVTTGYVAENNFTDDQFKSLINLIRYLKERYPGVTVHGHNEFSIKECPSFNVKEWLEDEDV